MSYNKIFQRLHQKIYCNYVAPSITLNSEIIAKGSFRKGESKENTNFNKAISKMVSLLDKRNPSQKSYMRHIIGI